MFHYNTPLLYTFCVDILKTKEEKAREEELIADLLYVVDKRAELSESTGDFKPKYVFVYYNKKSSK